MRERKGRARSHRGARRAAAAAALALLLLMTLAGSAFAAGDPPDAPPTPEEAEAANACATAATPEAIPLSEPPETADELESIGTPETADEPGSIGTPEAADEPESIGTPEAADGPEAADQTETAGDAGADVALEMPLLEAPPGGLPDAIEEAPQEAELPDLAAEEPQYDNARYQNLLAYRDKIAGKLQKRMALLAEALSAHLAAVTDGAESVRLYQQTGDGARTAVEEMSIAYWDDILIIYVAENLPDVEDPLDLLWLHRIPIDRLDRVFWDMTKVGVSDVGGALEITLTGRSIEEMVRLYGMGEAKADLVRELRQPEFSTIFSSLTDNMGALTLAERAANAQPPSGPEAQCVTREGVVAAAISLVGKVPYYWGGKYNGLGWNPGWGLPRTEVVKGRRTYGQTSAYGLDCSGFVSWAFINAAQDPAAIDRIGNGTSNQLRRSAEIGRGEVRMGDLAFRDWEKDADANHVGIVTEVTAEGTIYVVHAASEANTVVITEAEDSGFRHFRRPDIYAP